MLPSRFPNVAESTLLFVLVLCVAMLLRVPFLSLGYGLDPDAYRAALAAERLSAGLEYRTSRVPGYPVHEYLLYASRTYLSPFSANLMSLLAFAATSFVLFSALRHIQPRTSLPYTLVFMTSPIGLKPSTETMDYSISLFLLVLSMYLILKSRPSLGALSLGAATASRITNGAALIAVLPILLSHRSDRRLRVFIWFLVAFSISWLVFFSPVLVSYGPDFFSFYDHASNPPLLDIVKRGMLGTWGSFGIVAFVICFAAAISASVRSPERLKTPIVQTGCLLILIYWAAFFRLPHEVEYLLPAFVGFLMLLSCLVANKGLAWLLASAVALSAIVPAIGYYKARDARTDLVSCLVSRLNGLSPQGTVLVSTTMEKAYFSQGVFRDRPDLRILVQDQSDIEQFSGSVYAMDGSIFDRPAPTCSIPILQMHPSSAQN